MKNLLKIFIISIGIINSTYSQELIQVSMGSGYEYDLYYSAEQGITAFSERENWELAFSTNGNNIRINSSYANLYQVSSNIEDWEEPFKKAFTKIKGFLASVNLPT